MQSAEERISNRQHTVCTAKVTYFNASYWAVVAIVLLMDTKQKLYKGAAGFSDCFVSRSQLAAIIHEQSRLQSTRKSELEKNSTLP